MKWILTVGYIVLVTCLASAQQNPNLSNIPIGERDRVQLYCTTKYSRGLAQQITISVSWPPQGYDGLGVFIDLSCTNDLESLSTIKESWFQARSVPAWLGRARLEVGVLPKSACLLELDNFGTPTRATTTIEGNFACARWER